MANSTRTIGSFREKAGDSRKPLINGCTLTSRVASEQMRSTMAVNARTIAGIKKHFHTCIIS
jgi:hypothetical protein